MVDRLDLSRELPQKEWWRERRVAPATFFGFPDVTKLGIRGGQLYVEQMDAITIAVLADKCVKEKIHTEDIWEKFCKRAQQLSSRTHEPDLCYIFRAFARMDWFDQNFLTTYLGRLHRRLHHFMLPDIAVLLEAFANPRFRQSLYLDKTLAHLTLLLQHRDDPTLDDLSRTCTALRGLWPLPRGLDAEVRNILELIAEAILLRELEGLEMSTAIRVIDCYHTWGMVQQNRQTASTDLCWTLLRGLPGEVSRHGKEHPEELTTLAFAMGHKVLSYDALWPELVRALQDVAHVLSGRGVANAAYGLSRQRCPELFDALARRMSETRSEMSPLDCSRAACAFVRKSDTSCDVIFARILEVGLEKFDAESLSLLLSALSRAKASVTSAEPMAGAVVEVIHNRLLEFSAKELASIVKSFSVLHPDVKILGEIADRAVTLALEDEDFAPRHLSKLCEGLLAQRSTVDVGEKLVALLPVIEASLDKQPSASAVALIFGSLLRCPPTTPVEGLLRKCAGRMASTACDLSALMLVSLTEAMGNRTYPEVWTPPDALLRELASQLDMKRYDLPRRTLWRASVALEALGAQKLRLEQHDEPDA